MGAKEQGASETQDRWLTIPRTLCFILSGDDVLLMKRAAHKRVFPNRFNGVGGHIECNEDPYTSAKREIFEETGLDVHNLLLRAVYNVDAGAETGIILFVFTAHSKSRNFHTGTDEGTLHWVNRTNLLSLDLVEDLPIILPRLLDMPDDAQPYFVHVSYDATDKLIMQFAAPD